MIGSRMPALQFNALISIGHTEVIPPDDTGGCRPLPAPIGKAFTMAMMRVSG